MYIVMKFRMVEMEIYHNSSHDSQTDYVSGKLNLAEIFIYCLCQSFYFVFSRSVVVFINV